MGNGAWRVCAGHRSALCGMCAMCGSRTSPRRRLRGSSGVGMARRNASRVSAYTVTFAVIPVQVAVVAQFQVERVEQPLLLILRARSGHPVGTRARRPGTAPSRSRLRSSQRRIHAPDAGSRPDKRSRLDIVEQKGELPKRCGANLPPRRVAFSLGFFPMTAICVCAEGLRSAPGVPPGRWEAIIRHPLEAPGSTYRSGR
jgi:hypothetical protein